MERECACVCVTWNVKCILKYHTENEIKREAVQKTSTKRMVKLKKKKFIRFKGDNP